MPNDRGGYAYRQEKRKTVYMHHQIMGKRPGEQIDHKDGNGLNNQRDNLRRCTQGQNFANRRRLPKSRAGKFRGVYQDGPHASRGQWWAQIKVDGRSRRLGTFLSPEDAARAYDAAALEAWGEFASLNFP